jgi:hypothetical protein
MDEGLPSLLHLPYPLSFPHLPGDFSSLSAVLQMPRRWRLYQSLYIYKRSPFHMTIQTEDMESVSWQLLLLMCSAWVLVSLWKQWCSQYSDLLRFSNSMSTPTSAVLSPHQPPSSVSLLVHACVISDLSLWLELHQPHLWIDLTSSFKFPLRAGLTQLTWEQGCIDWQLALPS